MKQAKNYLEKLQKIRNSLHTDNILDRYSLLFPIKNYVLHKEKQLKQSSKYKKAQVVAEKLGIPYCRNEVENIGYLTLINNNPLLKKLFEIEAFPHEFTEHLVVDCCIQSQYWHITGLPDNINDVFPISIIYTDDNNLQKFTSVGDAYLKGIPFTSTIMVAKTFEIYTDTERVHYDLDDLPLSAKEIWNSIRQITKEWYQIASPLLKDVTDPCDGINIAWDAVPNDLRNKYIAAVRHLSREAWEWHQKQQSNRQKKQNRRHLSLNKKDELETGASLLFQKFRNSVSKPSNYDKGGGCYTTVLSNERQTLQAVAQVKPDYLETEHYLSDIEPLKLQERMAYLVMSMSDLTADVLDIISAKWIEQQLTHPDATIDITADDFLIYRGLQPQKSGTGRRGGFKNEARQQIARQIQILESIWLIVSEMTIYEEFETKNGKRRRSRKWQGESKVITVSSRVRQVKLDGTSEEPFAWRIRLGECLTQFLIGAGRQTALLSKKALNYDPKKYKWEKRLTRYFSWLWRINSQNQKPLTVATIMDNGIMESVDNDNPSRTRTRFENAMERLHSDKVILGWEYEKENEDAIGQRTWTKDWLQWKVIVEPPQPIIDQYAKITDCKTRATKQIKATKQKNVPEDVGVMITGVMLKEKRLHLQLTQLQAAEEIGISRPRISRIESCDSAVITKPELKKLKVWFEK